MPVLYVSPAGQDTNEGTAKFPFKTITRALQEARPGGVVQLAAGTYGPAERFPLQVPAGVTLTGTTATAVTIEGGGATQGELVQTLGKRNIAVTLSDRTQLREVTVTNDKGTGVVVIEGAALIIRNRFWRCQQHGVLVVGNAHPFLSKNEFIDNSVSGLAMSAQAKGEVRQNRFERSGDALFLLGESAPLVIDNELVSNRCAVLVTDYARPVLRQNQARGNLEIGLWTKERAQPDIGQPQDLGDNWFEGTLFDIRNEAAAPLATAGNQINPVRVQGRVAYLPSEIPDEAAVPAVLLGNVSPSLDLPEPTTTTEPSSGRAPLTKLSLDSRFEDVVGHWGAPFIEAMANKDLVKGFLNGTFAPDSQVTRAQFAALIAATFPEAEAVRPSQRFEDVPADFWGARAIRQAQTRGFISGFPDGSFRPNAPLTRVQAVVALVSGLALGDGHSESLLIYSDRAQIPSYAIEPVAAATERKLVVSYPDPFALRPLEPATRAETTALVYQALVAAGRAEDIASPFVPISQSAAPNFSDLSSHHWARDFIDPLVKKGWLSGFRDGTFRPDDPMTRAQFAVLLVGAFNPSPKRKGVSFRDVPDTFWGADVIQQAYRAEFISGFPDLTFDPNQPLTKLQALLALVSGLDLAALSAPEMRSLGIFADQGTVPQYARAAVATATQLGLVFNYPVPAELRPNRTATRAEVSAMVYQALVIAEQMPTVASRYQIQRR